MTSALVSSDWLSENIGNIRTKIIDANCFPPNVRRDPRREYEAAHIPGAVFFDINDIADTSSGLPHMLPSAEVFAQKVSALGLGNDDLIVAYDSMGIFGAARAWWMFRAMGHDKVVVLDGGLPKWQAESRPLTTDRPVLPPARFNATLQPELIRRLPDMLANLTTRRELVLDARSPGRFSGADPEVWPSRRAGHIPHALNIPFGTLLTPEQTMRPLPDLRARFAHLPPNVPLVASCGSGVSACVVALALFELGRSDVAIYDGSWAEWGLDGANHPVETGPLSTGQLPL